jgi:MFS family permease
MLDAFDFTIFLLIMVPIANEFGVSVTVVASVLAVTLWLRLVGAVAAGWLADRIGRKAPLMLAILWFSASNFVAGLSPNFTFLFIVRAALGVGMGAEWPAGAALAMEPWPARSREQNREVHTPILTIFKPALRGNTLAACSWMAGAMIVYYSVNGLFATWLQRDLQAPASLIATAILLSNLMLFAASAFWGWVGDRIGRRGAIIIQAIGACGIAPAYLLTTDLNWIAAGFVVQGAFGSAMNGLCPAYMTERFPTEVRSTASGFCYHSDLIFGGLVAPVASYFAVEHQSLPSRC